MSELSPHAGPIFVVGPMRSGTTLMRLVLDAHPNIAIGPESGFARLAEQLYAIPNWEFGPGWYRRFGETEEAFDRRVASFFDGLFSAYAHRQGKTRWGEKTPFHSYQMPLLARLYPDAKFIGMIRHPGAVVASLSKWGYDTAHSRATPPHDTSTLDSLSVLIIVDDAKCPAERGKVNGMARRASEPDGDVCPNGHGARDHGQRVTEPFAVAGFVVLGLRSVIGSGRSRRAP